jgi:hypothetical protein
MIVVHRFSSLALAALLAGCATAPLLVEPLGPAPPRRAASTPQGHLQVYTMTERVPDGDNTYFYPHGHYSVYATNGALVMRVRNASYHRDETPSTVVLPTGIYHVRAPGLIVPVAVERGHTTVVHLSGEWRPDRPRKEISEEDLVRMPSGHVVGWRARTAGIPGAK